MLTENQPNCCYNEKDIVRCPVHWPLFSLSYPPLQFSTSAQLYCMRKNKKMAAIRLQSYLSYWQSWIIDNELFGLFYLGVEWNEEIAALLKRGGEADDLVKLEEDKKKIISDITEGIQNQEVEIDQEVLVQNVSKLPTEFTKNIMENAGNVKQNLIDGKTFITDEEAATLGVAVAYNSIELKMHLFAITDTVTMIALSIRDDPDKFELKTFSNDIAQAAWKGVIVSRNIDSLMKIARAVTSQSTISLAIRNLVSEL